MKMTPKEFLQKSYPSGFPIANFQWEEDMPEIMEQYAAHCEESAWVTDGSLPTPIEGSYISVDCAVDCGFGKKYIGYYHFGLEQWRHSNNVGLIELPVIRYYILPQPPKQ